MSQTMNAQSEAADVGLIGAFGLETAVVAGVALAALVTLHLVLGWLEARHRLKAFARHSILVGLTLVALIVVALTLRDPVRDQVLKFLGILFSAVLAFSSTTLVGNGLAGLMLRTQRHFRGGDWLSVGEHFGQVAHRGLFFTTLQQESGDLATLPNLHLASQPVTVVAEPTFISATVSLGYDVPRAEVERLLLEAAAATGLEKAYVYVLELGDFSILYRVSGQLKETGELLTRRSELKCRMLDALHAGGVEIVSPNFMNQRVLPEDREFIPRVPAASEPVASGPAPEAEIFDKGQQAKTIEELEDVHRRAGERIKELREELEACESEERRAELERDLETLERDREQLSREIEAERVEAEGDS